MSKNISQKRVNNRLAIFGGLILVCLAIIAIYASTIKKSNSIVKEQIYNGDNKKEVISLEFDKVTIDKGWEKEIPDSFNHPDQFTDNFDLVNTKGHSIMIGQTYEFTIQNVSTNNVSDWYMEIKIPEDMYLNKCWNGEVEFFQYGSEESSGRFNTMNATSEEFGNVDVLELEELLVIPLKKGDIIRYYPSEAYHETPIEPTDSSNKSTYSKVIGMIFYSADGDIDFTDIKFEYKSTKSILKDSYFWIMFSILTVIVIMSAVYFGEYLIAKKYEDLRLEASDSALKADAKLSKQRDELLIQLAVIEAISDVYHTVYLIDLKTEEYKEVHSIPQISEITSKCTNFKEAFEILIKNLSVLNSNEAITDFFNIDTWKRKLSNQESISLDIISRRKGWNKITVIAASRDNFGNVTHVVITAQDINEQKKNEVKLQEAYIQAEKASNAKTIFLNSVSHDIRTPMNAIIGFTNLAKNHIDDRSLVENYLDKISISSKHLLSLINDVLDMSRIESGKVQIEPVKFSLSKLVDDINTIVQADTTAKQQIFVLNKNIINDNVIADRLRVNQILLNLLGNAIKFTPNGGTITLSVEQINTSEDKASYQIKVKDTGIGMPKEFISEIFKPFTRAKSSTVSGIQGTGLGMSITKNLVDLMNGNIRVESEEGKGSTFILDLTFPIYAGEVEDANEEDKKNDISVFIGKHILLVEDNILNQEIAIEILQEAGFKVTVLPDGYDCLKELSEAKTIDYDLILMDIQMPKMDGYETTRNIRALPNPYVSSVPIIAMTANAFEEDKQKALDAGMNAHIAKPINVNVLFDTLRRIL